MTDTKNLLIDTASRLFLENGYEATSVAAILQHAGVRSGSLYHFFKSKKQLLLAVLDRYIELLDPVILQPAEQRTDQPIERVFALLSLYREFLSASDCRLGCPIGNLALEVSGASSSARSKIVQNFENWRNGVQSWLEDAGDTLPANLDRAELANFVLVVMEGAQMQAKAHRDLAPYDAAIAQLREYFNILQQQAQRNTGDSGRADQPKTSTG